MKQKAWLLKLPLIALFSLGFYYSYLGEKGELNSPYVRSHIFPYLRSFSGFFTNMKFRVRGPQPPRNKILIIDVDNQSIDGIGRWPWHRDRIAGTIHNTLESGAKVIGMDAVFSEPDRRIPPELGEILRKHKLEAETHSLETDSELTQVLALHSKQVVLGWATTGICQSSYQSTADCPIQDPDVVKAYPLEFEKFAIKNFNKPASFSPSNTPLLSYYNLINNLYEFDAVSEHAGTFQAQQDADGFIRRESLIAMVNGQPHPSLALELARVGMKDDLQVSLDEMGRVSSVGFSNSKKNLRTTPLGVLEVNFRGPMFSFPYVSLVTILDESPTAMVTYRGETLPFPCTNCKLVNSVGPGINVFEIDEKELFQDAYAILGVSATGVFDMRAFPFDSNTPGVEGHATILDNILSDDYLTPTTYGNITWVTILLLMTIGAMVFAYVTQKVESVPALLTFVISAGTFAYFDQKILFEQQLQNWNTGFLYTEFFCLFAFTIAIKYVLEERNKKFIKGAFSKYVAPTIVESILKDPTKLTVGGERRELSILFSDIRGFTTLSERLDAKAVSVFLNDYLGLMTDILFDHHGTLDKYIGDAVMAFWGAPLDQSKHALNACRSAVQMIRTLNENKERYLSQYGVEVNVGIGVNSGMVSVGNMGSNRVFEYTVIGDHVNLASRVEGLTKYYGVPILTTRHTFDCIRAGGDSLPPHRVLDQVKVKGKTQTVELIQILDREYSQEGLILFEEGRLLYEKREWNQAITKFKACNELMRGPTRESDGACELFIERCEGFRMNPPNSDWDGSWEMVNK